MKFLNDYQLRIAQERRIKMAMRPWKELHRMVSEGPAHEIRFESVAELGFGAGMLTRRFGRWYYKATTKDFLKHRVLTFGSDLSPDVLWKRGLSKMFDVEARYEKLHMTDDFRMRLGVVLAEFDRLHDEVRGDRDSFMSAFWSGYALQGYDATVDKE